VELREPADREARRKPYLNGWEPTGNIRHGSTAVKARGLGANVNHGARLWALELSRGN